MICYQKLKATLHEMYNYEKSALKTMWPKLPEPLPVSVA